MCFSGISNVYHVLAWCGAGQCWLFDIHGGSWVETFLWCTYFIPFFSHLLSLALHVSPHSPSLLSLVFLSLSICSPSVPRAAEKRCTIHSSSWGQQEFPRSHVPSNLLFGLTLSFQVLSSMVCLHFPLSLSAPLPLPPALSPFLSLRFCLQYAQRLGYSSCRLFSLVDFSNMQMQQFP